MTRVLIAMTIALTACGGTRPLEHPSPPPDLSEWTAAAPTAVEPPAAEPAQDDTATAPAPPTQAEGSAATTDPDPPATGGDDAPAEPAPPAEEGAP